MTRRLYETLCWPIRSSFVAGVCLSSSYVRSMVRGSFVFVVLVRSFASLKLIDFSGS